MTSVDGVDCPYKTHTLDNGKPDKRFYTYKTRQSGLRYEVAISIRSDDIVWISGPHLPGVYNDLQIFRMGLMHELDEGERVEADLGYEAEAPRYVKVPGNLAGVNQKKMRGRLRKRHETINRRLKVYRSLKTTFRQSTLKHSICFRCAAILLQLALESGQQALFDMREYDDRLTDQQATEIFGI